MARRKSTPPAPGLVAMVGPAGPEGCSRFGCTKRAVETQVYTVAHPGQDVYDVQYKWCNEHLVELSRQDYPNFWRIK